MDINILKDRFKNKFLNRFYIMILAMSLTLAIGIFIVAVNMSSQAIITNMQQRADTMYTYVEQILPRSAFSKLNTKKNEIDPLYVRLSNRLNDLRIMTNIKYLYTAKKNSAGELIYIIDGYLNEKDDFRHIGDLIEPEITAQLNATLTTGKPIYAPKIQETQWGAVYVVYYPYIYAGKVYGAIGMEFDADKENAALKQILIRSALIAFVIFGLIIITTRYFIKKIADPLIYKMAYIDSPTSLYNRNMYEKYISDFQYTSNNLYIISFDLNDLKVVNDTFGHKAGDLYILNFAQLLEKYFLSNACIFRIGGDEFCVFGKFTSLNELNDYLDKMRDDATTFAIPVSFAFGFVKFKEQDELLGAIKRADNFMYQMKRKMKANNEVYGLSQNHRDSLLTNLVTTNFNEAVIVLDPNLNVLEINAVALEYLDYSYNEFIGENFISMVTSTTAKNTLQEFFRALSAQKYLNGQLKLYDKKGKLHEFLYRGYAILDVQGSVLYYVIYFVKN